MGYRTNHRRRLLDRGRGFKSERKHLFTHGTRGHASQYQKYDNVCRYHFPAAGPQTQRRGERQRRDQQFDPGGKGEKAPLWNADVTLFFLFCGDRWAMGGSLLVLRVFLSVCVLLLCSLNYCSFQVTTFQRAEKHERRRGSSR